MRVPQPLSQSIRRTSTHVACHVSHMAGSSMVDSSEKVLEYDREFMDELVAWKNRSYTSYDTDGNRVHIKYYSKATSVKITQWNHDHFKMTYAWSVKNEVSFAQCCAAGGHCAFGPNRTPRC